MRRVFYGVILTIMCLTIFSGVAWADTPPDLLSEQDIEIINEQAFTDEKVLTEVRANPVTPNSTNGFHNIIISLLGNYQPVTVDYTYTSTQGYTSHSIDTSPDWSWICSAIIFLVVLFCTFKFIGGIFSK